MRAKYLLFFSLTAALSASTIYAQSYVPEPNDHKMKVAPQVQLAAFPFDIHDVRLLDGPFKEAMEADARYLLQIEPDRLLADFRLHAGLPAKGKKYGGWESSGLAGHSLGHYLSACSMQYASTGDRRFLDRANYIVDELSLIQSGPAAAKATSTVSTRPAAAIPSALPAPSAAAPSPSTWIDRSGYLGAIPGEDSLWSQVAAGKIHSRGFDLDGAWSPWYTVHKIMAGLLDAYLYCNNSKALRVETKMADWTGNTIANLDDSLIQKMLLCEYGGMNEVLVNTYAITGDKKFLALSRKFHDKRILDTLALQKDILPGKHSNTQIPKVIGCARRYELTGDAGDAAIARFFWATVVNDHSYATGGNSNYEYLGPARQLNDKLSDNTTETCNTYNMLKLTRHLFAWAPSATLMDYYGKGLYNHILASQDHENGMMCYFVPLRMGTHKEYSDSFNTFTCCVGSGMENHVKYGESIYYQGRDGSLYVNLFIPSRLDWKDKKISVVLQTQLPADDKITLKIGAPKPTPFLLRIRRPYWATKGMQVRINGQLQKDLVVHSNGYLLITRTWQNKDLVEITIPESIHTQSLPDNADRIALFYGPVLLAGILGNTEPDPQKGIPVLVSNEKDPGAWVRQEGTEGLVFRTSGVGRPTDVSLIPFNRTRNEYYSVYWDHFTEDGWAAQQKKYRQDQLQQQQLEDHTIDKLLLGEMQPERDHSFSGESLFTGEEHGQKWRAAGEGGNFSFTMRVDSSAANSLFCSFWGSDHRGRIWDIRVDGQTIATQDLNAYKESKFYNVSYALPAKLTRGKQTVHIQFQAKSPHNSVGPVFGTIRIIINN